MTSGEAITVGAAEVGRTYNVTVCALECETKICAKTCKSYDAKVTSRSATHTYLSHAHGDLALPNNISIDLIRLTPNE